jgi:alpha-N-arabinofuranosidase
LEVEAMGKSTIVGRLSFVRMASPWAPGVVRALVVGALLARAATASGAEPAGADVSQCVVDLARTSGEISPLLFGHNLEHTRRAVWQGISAQMLANRKFAGASTTDGSAPAGPMGCYGQLRTQGAPDQNGVAAHWYGVGGNQVKFYVDDELALAGRTSQKIDVLHKGVRGGVGQAGIALCGGTKYEIRLQLRTHFEMKAFLQITDKTQKKTYFELSQAFAGNQWHTWSAQWTAPQTDPSARLEITFEGPGSAWLGAASLMPTDHFHGLRRDVLAVLKDMSVPLLRWPGGNFTRNWKWKDGMLPVDSRPPVTAKNSETLPFTDNYDFQEIGIDEFMALCEYLGAEPTLVLNLGDELQSAADLVEYCNGPADRGWGKLRAERGHAKPYHVKYWSVGNETFGQWMGPSYFPPAEYGLQVARFSAAMRKVDPSIRVIASGAGGYAQGVVRAAGASLDMISGHHYRSGAEAGTRVEPRVLDRGRAPTVALRNDIAHLRAEIDRSKPANKTILISLDEWNLWHRWFTQPFQHPWHSGPVDGMYVASGLNVFCRESGKLGIHSALFFEPVNEGCLVVGPHAAHLTAAGQVFRLFRAHQGNQLLEVRRLEKSDDVDVCASLGARGRRLVATVLNRNSSRTRTTELEMADGRTLHRVSATVLSAADLSAPDAVFEEKPLAVEVQGNKLRVELPRYAVVRLEAELQP